MEVIIMATKWFQKLTPKLAWDQYVDMSIELFVSHFIIDGITDVGEMCLLYKQDIPSIFEQLYTQDQLDRIGELLEQYIKEKGYDESKLYTAEQLEQIFQEQANEIIAVLRRL